MGTYFYNKETSKIHLDFDQKEFDTLPPEQKKQIEDFFLWSSKRKQWVSKAKKNFTTPISIAKKCNLTLEKEIGDTIDFETQLEQKILKAENRIEKYQELSEKAKKESELYQNTATNITKHIPMGQPVLVGHYSEKRHRKDLERADSNIRKSIEASKKEEQYQDKIKSVSKSLDESKYNDINYLETRIKEISKEIETTKTALQKDQKDQLQKEILLNLLQTLESQLSFLNEKKSNIKIVFTKETLIGKKYVKDRWGWHEIAKLNRTTVSVKTGYSWNDNISYLKILACK